MNLIIIYIKDNDNEVLIHDDNFHCLKMVRDILIVSAGFFCRIIRLRIKSLDR